MPVVLASRSEDKRGEWDAFKGRVPRRLTAASRSSSGARDRQRRRDVTLTPKNEWDICAGTLLVEEAGDGYRPRRAPLRFNQPKTSARA
jgi:myo-inositol-1(or 4)-monophosphatase